MAADGPSVGADRVGAVTLFVHRDTSTAKLAEGLADLLATPLPDPFAQEVVAGRRVFHVGEEMVEGRGECHGSSFP